MPQPVSRLFPKLFVKSDDAQLVLTTNAIAILNTADGVSQLPTRRAPKQLAIVLDHSIRLVLHVNGVNVAPKLLSKHLQVALVSSASFLNVSSSILSQEDHVLVVEPRRSIIRPTQTFAHAVLDYIALDYRFSHLSSTFEDTAGSMSSRDEGIFLPMREMLDQVVHRFIGQLIRHLPEAFGSWKDALAGEIFLARHAARHLGHVLSFSNDAVFQRKIQKQLKRINASMHASKEELVAEMGQDVIIADNLEEDSMEMDSSDLKIRILLPFAVQATYKSSVRPKISKQQRVIKPETPLDLLEEDDPTMTSSQDTLVSIISVDNEDNLPLDSPASIVQNNQSLSPVISVLSLDLEYAEENILYDSDMELDLEASNWDPEPQMDTMTSDRKDPMVVDNWIQSHISQTEKGWYTATMQDSIPLPLPMMEGRTLDEEYYHINGGWHGTIFKEDDANLLDLD